MVICGVQGTVSPHSSLLPHLVLLASVAASPPWPGVLGPESHPWQDRIQVNQAPGPPGRGCHGA